MTVAKLVSDWETKGVDILNGALLLSKLNTSTLPFPPSNDDMRKRMITALATRASKGCHSYELRKLLNAVEPENLDSTQVTLLKNSVSIYRQHWLSGDLWLCGNEAQFDELEGDLKIIANWMGNDFEELNQAIMQAKAELYDSQVKDEERMYGNMKEHWSEQMNSERAIDDLFDSLRGSH